MPSICPIPKARIPLNAPAAVEAEKKMAILKAKSFLLYHRDK